MFAVYGNDLYAVLLRQIGYDLPSAYKGLFIGKRNRLTRANCRKGVSQPRKASRRNQRDVTIRKQGIELGIAQLSPCGAVRKTREKLPFQRVHSLFVATRKKRGKGEALGILPNDTNRLFSDIARTADKRDFLLHCF